MGPDNGGMQGAALEHVGATQLFFAFESYRLVIPTGIIEKPLVLV